MYAYSKYSVPRGSIVWYIYLYTNLPHKSTIHVCKYTLNRWYGMKKKAVLVQKQGPQKQGQPSRITFSGYKKLKYTLGFRRPCEEVFGPQKTYLKHLLRRYLEGTVSRNECLVSRKILSSPPFQEIHKGANLAFPYNLIARIQDLTSYFHYIYNGYL